MYEPRAYLVTFLFMNLFSFSQTHFWCSVCAKEKRRNNGKRGGNAWRLKIKQIFFRISAGHLHLIFFSRWVWFSYEPDFSNRPSCLLVVAHTRFRACMPPEVDGHKPPTPPMLTQSIPPVLKSIKSRAPAGHQDDLRILTMFIRCAHIPIPSVRWQQGGR